MDADADEARLSLCGADSDDVRKLVRALSVDISRFSTLSTVATGIDIVDSSRQANESHCISPLALRTYSRTLCDQITLLPMTS